MPDGALYLVDLHHLTQGKSLSPPLLHSLAQCWYSDVDQREPSSASRDRSISQGVSTCAKDLCMQQILWFNMT